ncbi:MAG: aminodeoxychorismate synthase component I [Sediminimonas qiaohouensis]|uniref:Aminodeoxychorismate synthase component I n=1 Tax=Sediminimonas qiaohouensis TaxID=552061 RepID=A0A7C9H945_9RHOB|nr:aminodeoxychorismate synthase component I [Sediminimonas qiaohouensis]MTJ03126.1 aminodeoxychorismate synthase component I [Sediminimonas qiaohouensis]
MSKGMIMFDEGPLHGGSVFASPRDVIRADTPDELPAAWAAMERARSSGLWLAGYISYEAGYATEASLAPLMPARRDLPLVQVGVFDAPDAAARYPLPTSPAELSAAVPEWDLGTYSHAFDKVQERISAGDTYQINLTFPMHAHATGDPLALYARLRARQPVGHGAYVDLGGPAILSRSPELFFRIDSDGWIETRPMKGTVARGKDKVEDSARRDWLAASEKNRAENLMIVDLLRNDISRVAEPGSVRVPALFTIESYATVHQMTSLVRARVHTRLGLADLMTALFPCGSVTGAPKIRAMQIISELEHHARDVYCGAIGWVAPSGQMSFNVAIRTMVVWPDGQVRFNVGGGVVHDSTAIAEYEEALWKARFATLSPMG